MRVEAPAQPSARLEARLEAALGDQFGLHTDSFVHSAAEWLQIIEKNSRRRSSSGPREPGDARNWNTVRKLAALCS